MSPGLPGEARLQLRRSQKNLKNLRGTAGVPPPTRCSSKNGLQEVGISFFYSLFFFVCLFPTFNLRIVALYLHQVPLCLVSGCFQNTAAPVLYRSLIPALMSHHHEAVVRECDHCESEGRSAFFLIKKKIVLPSSWFNYVTHICSGDANFKEMA